MQQSRLLLMEKTVLKSCLSQKMGKSDFPPKSGTLCKKLVIRSDQFSYKLDLLTFFGKDLNKVIFLIESH